MAAGRVVGAVELKVAGVRAGDGVEGVRDKEIWEAPGAGEAR